MTTLIEPSSPLAAQFESGIHCTGIKAPRGLPFNLHRLHAHLGFEVKDAAGNDIPDTDNVRSEDLNFIMHPPAGWRIYVRQIESPNGGTNAILYYLTDPQGRIRFQLPVKLHQDERSNAHILPRYEITYAEPLDAEQVLAVFSDKKDEVLATVPLAIIDRNVCIDNDPKEEDGLPAFKKVLTLPAGKDAWKEANRQLIRKYPMAFDPIAYWH